MSMDDYTERLLGPKRARLEALRGRREEQKRPLLRAWMTETCDTLEGEIEKMEWGARLRGEHEGAHLAALGAGEQGVLDAHGAHHGVVARACAPYVGAAAVVTEMLRAQGGKLLLKFAYLGLCSLLLRAGRLGLGFKIATLAFVCRKLGLQEFKALLEDRRRAMLIDELFERLKQIDKAHGGVLGECMQK
jgi:hypothetical protein